jgi:hypothetical protein
MTGKEDRHRCTPRGDAPLAKPNISPAGDERSNALTLRRCYGCPVGGRNMTMDTLWGFFCLVTVAGVLIFCFRHALPLHRVTRDAADINRHSSHGDTMDGSNWSTIDSTSHHHGP